MRPFSAGNLQHRVTVQLKSTLRDSYGQVTDEWTDQGTYWADVTPVRARDLLVINQIKAQVTHTVRMRWLGAVDLGPATHRLMFRGRILGIVDFIDVEELHIMYELTCQEIQV